MKPKLRIISLTVAANLLLILAKLFVALITGSLAVFATLIDSIFDLLASFIAFFGLKESEKPADAEHPYGHEKFEHVSSLAVVSFIFLTALYIAYEAVQRLLSPTALSITGLELAVLLGTIALDILLVRYLNKHVPRHKSLLLEATRAHYSADVLQNGVAVVGVLFSSMGYPLADPIAALTITYFIVKPAFRVGQKSFSELVDTSPSPETLEKLREIIRSTSGVRGYTKLRARQVAGKIYLDFEMQVDGAKSVSKAHALAHHLQERLKKRVPAVKDVVIHIEPKR
ncbi:cation diffusion facilitator family transporter [Candidatus Micrarchaeota archaeon]|nr:cation diffusion facilitator family transporter [Candidatus Micrarchaeota archaeon]